MDFGVVGFDGLGGAAAETGFASLASSSSDQETKHKWYGSGFHKQERSAGTVEEDWRSSKMPKTDDFLSASKTMPNNSTHFSDGQQLLSFSNSPNSEAVLVDKSTQNASLPYFHQPLSAYNRSAGHNTGSFNGAAMHWAIAGARGPFTPSQWMELEHQALIYKYITANVPIPSNLLIPIKKALDSAFPNGLQRPNTLGWGSIHLGFSNNTDPEPGRCRRTDGKKWRCWRDAVPDQKYCERHMNRGRHRSRKPVEPVAGTTAAATTTTTSKQLMPSASSSASSMSIPAGGGSSSLSIANQQLKSLQPAASNSSAATQMNRMFVNKESVGERMHQTPGPSTLSKENPFLIQKQQMGYEESSRTEFGLVPSDSLLNPSQKGSSLMSCRNYGSSSQNLTDPAETNSQQHSLRHFIDDWPKNQSDRPAISWPDQFDMQSDRTQLSISIPIASSDFIPSTSSTNNEKLTLSPLRLSRELDPKPMGLGVGSALNAQNNKQANWIPISWETSLGGPLGEVLHHTNNNTAAECKNSSVLNLMTEGWDKNSPSSLGSSPTGVLQKTAFGSLSNSSAGSSPRAENNNLLGSSILDSSSLPAL
ncbi:unnamed protein product [Prunus brigantina]